ncbi:MAG TPA: plastocyanin/azurin family copper-binding protein [Gaiellaceae bacterium]|nr:plastocyanin/azurin family copper-binding protein [Gaiellaceae bacterium]
MSRKRLAVWLSGALLAVLATALPTLAATRAPSGTGEEAATEATTTVRVVILKSGFTLSTKVATAGTVVFRLVNRSKVSCKFRIAAKTSGVVAPRRSATLRVTLTRPGSYRYLCTQRSRVAGLFSVAPNLTTTVDVDMTDFAFELSEESVPWGTVAFRLVNKGGVGHDLQVAGKRSAVLNRGQTGVLDVTFPRPGQYPFLCTIPGHAAAGMKGVLEVTQS